MTEAAVGVVVSTSLKLWWHGPLSSATSTAAAASKSDSIDPHHRLVLPLLDLRCDADYAQRRLVVPTSVSATATAPILVHIPWTQLSGRAFELPPRHSAFGLLLPNCFQKLISSSNNAVVDCPETRLRHDSDEDDVEDDAELEEAWIFLQRWFPTLIKRCSSSPSFSDQFVLDPQHLKQQQQHVPWNIPLVLLACDELWQDAKELGILSEEHDDHYDQPPMKQEEERAVPQPRLWQPHPMIEHHLLPLLQSNMKQWEAVATRRDNYNKADTTYNSDTLEIWDLGSGAGRDVCFLAEAVLASASSSTSSHLPVVVCGIDHLQASASRCLPFWKRRQVESNTCHILLDLHNVAQVEHVWTERTARRNSSNGNGHGNNGNDKMIRSIVCCCYAVRFYHRPLLEWLLHHVSPSSSSSQAHAEENRHEKIRSCTIPFVVAVSHFCKPSPEASWNFDHPKVRTHKTTATKAESPMLDQSSHPHHNLYYEGTSCAGTE